MAGALVRWCVARCGGGGWASPGGRLPVLRGASGVRRCPSPGRSSSGACSQGSATRVSRARSVRAVDPARAPQRSVCGPALLAVGVAEGRPRGGACHRCEGRLVSAAAPPPAALALRSVQPGFRDPRVPGAVDAGVWTQHRSHSVRPCGPTLLAVGLAEWRPRGGRFPPL